MEYVGGVIFLGFSVDEKISIRFPCSDSHRTGNKNNKV